VVPSLPAVLGSSLWFSHVECLAEEWPEKRLWSVLEAMAGIQGRAQCRANGPTATSTLQNSGDQLACAIMLSRVCFGVIHPRMFGNCTP